MLSIEDTVYKGIEYALDPTKRKIIFNGTPFNKMDILYQAVESGAWDVNVWPVCEKFPCTREEFAGSWEDRFSYDYVVDQYNDAVKLGKVASFNQELLLRITSEEERLVQDSEIQWYSRKSLLKRRNIFNFYITTDFATSEKQTADNSVISVWAYNSNGDWFWVDGVCKRQKMNVSIDDLFRFVSIYGPQSVGVEINGQQNAFIEWLQAEMLARNVWFNLAMQKGTPGIRSTVSKLSKFNLVVPLFAAGKIFFPEELREGPVMSQFISEISLATQSGLKGKDDCLDTISMLPELNAWLPAKQEAGRGEDFDIFGDEDDDKSSNIDSYVV
jgi:phage terminase large subunit-like protein